MDATTTVYATNWRLVTLIMVSWALGFAYGVVITLKHFDAPFRALLRRDRRA